MLDFVLILSWVSVGLYLFLGGTFLFLGKNKDSKNSNLFIGLFCFDLFCFYSMIAINSAFEWKGFEWLCPILLCSGSLIPFLSYVWMDSVMTKNFKIQFKHYMFLVFPAVYLIYIIIFIIPSPQKLTAFSSNMKDYKEQWFFIILVVNQISFAINFYFLRKKYSVIARNVENYFPSTQILKWIKNWGLIIMITAILFHLPLLVIESPLYFAAIPLFMIHFFFIIIVSAFRYPELFNELRETQEIIISENEEHKSTSDTKEQNENFKEWQEKLEEVMYGKKPYLNTNLNINILAKEIEIKPYQLSLLLNQYNNSKFNEYINKFRIDEAIVALKNQEQKSKTIDAIGKEVGFKSKSSFYAAFKQVTQKTPSEFIKSLA